MISPELNKLAKDLLEQIAKHSNVTVDDAYFGMSRIRSHKTVKPLGDFVVITEDEYNSLCQDRDSISNLVVAGYGDLIKECNKDD